MKPEDVEATFEFEAGRLVCPQVREFFKRLQFRGYEFEYLEGSGFFSRMFTVRGKLDAVTVIRDSIKSWVEIMEEIK